VVVRCDDEVFGQLARDNTHARAVRAAVKNEIEPLISDVLAHGPTASIHICRKDGHYVVE
jgi:hypothetical protein